MAFNSLFKSKVAADGAKTSKCPTNIFGDMSRSPSNSDDEYIDIEDGDPLSKISEHETAEMSVGSTSDSLDGDNSYDRGVMEVSKVR
jgi:hypothetical protein